MIFWRYTVSEDISNTKLSKIAGSHPSYLEVFKPSIVLIHLKFIFIFTFIILFVSVVSGTIIFRTTPDTGVVLYFISLGPVVYLLLLLFGYVSQHFRTMILDIIKAKNTRTQTENLLNEIMSLSKNSDLPIINRLLLGEEIRKRAKNIRARTGIILLTIGIILVAAALIVIFAGQLTSIDAAAVGPTDRMKTELKDLDSHISSLSEARVIVRQLEALRAQKIPLPNTRELADLESKIDRLSNSSAYSIPKDSQSIEDAYKSTNLRKEGISQLMQEAWKKEVASERGYNDAKYIVATAITRIGVVVILVFLVQILLGLYRYNTKLLTFYNSYIDIITIWDGDPTKLEFISKAFSPPKLDFGKEPKHPLEDIIRAVDHYKKSSSTEQDNKTTLKTT